MYFLFVGDVAITVMFSFENERKCNPKSAVGKGVSSISHAGALAENKPKIIRKSSSD